MPVAQDERDPTVRRPVISCNSRRQFLSGIAAASWLLLPATAGGEDSSDATVPSNATVPSYDGLIRNAEPLDQLHSIVVANGSEVLFARSFHGPPIERPVNIKSVSKTIVALLTGIAIERGVVASVDERIGDLVPDLIPDDAPAAIGAITVSDLLTMRAGLERTSGPNYGAWVQSNNWVRYILSQPLVAEPGGSFLYSTGSYHLLGAILARKADSTLHALAREWLAEPLGIRIPPWMRDPQGFYMGGNNMALTPASLARIGQVVVCGGKWAGNQVIPKEWLDDSWLPRTRSPFSGHSYGYGWYLTEMDGVKIAYARGYGGQMLYVAPDISLTIAITSDPSRPARSHGHVGELHRLVAEHILHA